MTADSCRHWGSHRWLALGLRLLVFVMPIGASVAVAFMASRLLPAPIT